MELFDDQIKKLQERLFEIISVLKIEDIVPVLAEFYPLEMIYDFWEDQEQRERLEEYLRS